MLCDICSGELVRFNPYDTYQGGPELFTHTDPTDRWHIPTPRQQDLDDEE